MDGTVVYVLVIVFIALVFDFINGFHDSANSIADNYKALVFP